MYFILFSLTGCNSFFFFFFLTGGQQGGCALLQLMGVNGQKIVDRLIQSPGEDGVKPVPPEAREWQKRCIQSLIFYV